MLRKLQQQMERLAEITGLSHEELIKAALSGKSAGEVAEMAKKKGKLKGMTGVLEPVAGTCDCDACKNGEISGMAIHHQGVGKMVDGSMKLEVTTRVVTNQKEYTSVLRSSNMSQEMQQELCSTNILRIFSRNPELSEYKPLVIGKLLEKGEF